jgi:nicotinamide phosphoribosyltransferase
MEKRIMKIDPLMAIDFYKAGHIYQYPEGTNLVYSNMTARSAKNAKWLPDYDNKIVIFGIKYFIENFLIETWNENFFNKPIEEIVQKYQKRMDGSLGVGVVKTDHIRELHKLGHLPLWIKAMAEGQRVPVGIPFLTIQNTLPQFFWLTNYIETIMSSYLWKPITSATIAFEYRRLLEVFAKITGSDKEFVKYQAHDFSFRGMSGPFDAALSGAGHLTSFSGTDSVLSLDLIDQYYFSEEEYIAGTSVPATEHSVMCMGLEEGELDTFKRLIKTYPTGALSVVSDTWDFWRVITEYMVELKSEIMDRSGKLIIRPDSGDPVKIIIGDIYAPYGSPEFKGAVECLWDIFGGSITNKGYKVLDSHIGLIYGDSITLDRAVQILKGLERKGFASSNIVFGIGSYTYQYVTRDTFGFAIKATYGAVNSKVCKIQKNPKTDTGEKKSAIGFLRVDQNKDGEYILEQDVPGSREGGYLGTVFLNGESRPGHKFSTIRSSINKSLEMKLKEWDMKILEEADKDGLKELGKKGASLIKSNHTYELYIDGVFQFESYDRKSLVSFYNILHDTEVEWSKTRKRNRYIRAKTLLAGVMEGNEV